MRSLLKGLEDGSIAKPPAAKAQPDVYHDPVSGFTRTLGVGGEPASVSGKKKRQKKMKRQAEMSVDLMVAVDDDEVAEVALALAASLGGEKSESSGGSTPRSRNDERYAVPCLQSTGRTRGKDLAGFHVPTLSQVVDAVAPKPPTPSTPAALPPSRLGSAARGGRSSSLWKRASERPNAETKVYRSSQDKREDEELVDVHVESRVKEEEEEEEEDQPRRIQHLSLSPPRQPPHSSSVSLSLSVNQLEVPADRVELVRHELQDISNAYANACQTALTEAQVRVRAARQDYFSRIGQSAVERDMAIREVMHRNQLHEGHLTALPMLSYGASEFPEPSDLSMPREAGTPEIVAAPEEEEDNDDDDGLEILADVANESDNDFEEPVSPSPAKKARKGKEEWDEPTPEQRSMQSTPPLPQVSREYVVSSPLPMQTPAGMSPVRGVNGMNLDTPFGAGGGLVDLTSSPPAPHLTQASIASQEPDFESMSADELKARMQSFGLNGGTERFMRDKLKEIWAYQNRALVSESLRKAEQLQRAALPLDDTVTPVRGGKKAPTDVHSLNDNNDGGGRPKDPGSPPASSQAASISGDRELDIVTFIRQGSYFERMLLYEPIPILQLQEDLRAVGVNISKKSLADFLDSKGIVHHDPESKWK